MMPLGYSEINENIKISQNKKKNKRKTIKKRNSNNRVEKFLNSMNKKESFEGRSSTRKSIKAYDSDEDEFGEPYEREVVNDTDHKQDSEVEKEEISKPSVMEWDKDKQLWLLREGFTQQENIKKNNHIFLINMYLHILGLQNIHIHN